MLQAPELLAAKPKRLRFLIFNTAGRILHHARAMVCPAATPGRSDRRMAHRTGGASLTAAGLRIATLTDGYRARFSGPRISVRLTGAAADSHRHFRPLSRARHNGMLKSALAHIPVPPSPLAPTPYGRIMGRNAVVAAK